MQPGWIAAHGFTWCFPSEFGISKREVFLTVFIIRVEESKKVTFCDKHESIRIGGATLLWLDRMQDWSSTLLVFPVQWFCLWWWNHVSIATISRSTRVWGVVGAVVCFLLWKLKCQSGEEWRCSVQLFAPLRLFCRGSFLFRCISCLFYIKKK